MKLDEQILSCARVNGYTGKGTKVTRPKYNSGGDMGEWWIQNDMLAVRVTDEQFKQW